MTKFIFPSVSFVSGAGCDNKGMYAGDATSLSTWASNINHMAIPTGSGNSYEITPLDVSVDGNYFFYFNFRIGPSFTSTANGVYMVSSL